MTATGSQAVQLTGQFRLDSRSSVVSVNKPMKVLAISLSGVMPFLTRKKKVKKTGYCSNNRSTWNGSTA